MLDASSRILRSDRHYWHRYTEVYGPILSEMTSVRVAVEIGVFRGVSVAWLADRFPEASIVGVDILPVQPGWPESSRISYRHADQGNRAEIIRAFDPLPGTPDFIIEDGSHVPQHQTSCRSEGFSRLRPGGLYILDYLCTSHPMTAAFAHHSLDQGRQLPTALHVLMALQHRMTALVWKR